LPLKIRYTLLLSLSLLLSSALRAQDTLPDTLSPAEYSFIRYEADTLRNAERLLPFFNKLLRLENGDSVQLNIVQIGDSHIQADFLTREVRKNMQLRFGNAGRGLVFPLRVAGTNEPADYRSAANAGWTSARIISSSRFPEPGLSGIAVYSDRAGISFDISTLNHDDLDYSFDRVTLIHRKDSLQFDCRITDAPDKFGYLMSAEPLSPGEQTTEVRFLKPSSFVRVQAEQTEAAQREITVDGIVLSNSKPGVLYHSIGINGAHFADYNATPRFYQQLAVLRPDLVIISLGTNEGADLKITSDDIHSAVKGMIANIRRQNPGACILLTTPADDYFRKKYKNPYLETVHRALVESADSENVACWDLYEITGGFGSGPEWKKAGLMQHDGVHYSRLGYTVQGTLLYNAIIDSYQKHATD
jgi:lysophospholipase L1-like esterase